MAADVFDDADKVIVRIEAPGMRREDFNVEVNGDVLTVWGEKRIDSEATEGRWHRKSQYGGVDPRAAQLPFQTDTPL